MRKQDTHPSSKPRKFLFDLHNFDDRKDPGDLADAPPPPPVFSEAELNQARRESYDLGHRDGHGEAQASFEKQVADTLVSIRDHFRVLFAEEERRSHDFEKEAVQLAATIFDRAFPTLNDHLGLDDVRHMIKNVLETVREQPEILIEVPAAYVAPVQTHVNSLIAQDGGPRCTVRESDSLPGGSCRMTWVNGNAARIAPQIAAQIQIKIEQVLADKAILTDNKGDMNNVSTAEDPRDE